MIKSLLKKSHLQINHLDIQVINSYSKPNYNNRFILPSEFYKISKRIFEKWRDEKIYFKFNVYFVHFEINIEYTYQINEFKKININSKKKDAQIKQLQNDSQNKDVQIKNCKMFSQKKDA